MHYPAGQKVCSKSLYLVRFLRYSHFFIFSKNPRWPPKVAKIEIFSLYIGYSCTTLRVKNSLEIVLSRTVFEIFTLFHFPQKSKKAAKSGENLNFSPWHTILLCHPVGQKFAQNLYLVRFSKYSLFLIFHKNPRWPAKVTKIEIFLLYI